MVGLEVTISLVHVVNNIKISFPYQKLKFPIVLVHVVVTALSYIGTWPHFATEDANPLLIEINIHNFRNPIANVV